MSEDYWRVDKRTARNLLFQIQILARASLQDKWHDFSDQLITDSCSFCDDVITHCEICLCPPLICSNHATHGYIHLLRVKYAQYQYKYDPPLIYVKRLEPDDLKHMRNLFFQILDACNLNAKIFYTDD